MKKIIDAIPKFFLGPLLVLGGIFYFILQDPPKTVCDIQFEIFKKENEKYVYPYKKKKIEIPAVIKRDIEMCQNTNTAGGCYDWMAGLKGVLKTTRNLPTECRSRISELNPLKSWMDQSLFLFSQISWNSSQFVRPDLFHWLEKDDVILFCRLRMEYIRLIGVESYKAQEKRLLDELVKLKKLPPPKVWERTVLSYKCPTLT